DRWIIRQWHEHDGRGHVAFVADPFYWDGALPATRPAAGAVGQSVQWDAYGRLVHETLPSGARKSISYAAFSRTTNVDGLQPVTSTFDGLDRAVHTERTIGGKREWADGTVDPADRVTAVSLQGGTVTRSFA